MPDPGQLPHLIKLLDDESPEIRGSVQRALQEFGESLKEHLRSQRIELTPEQSALLQGIVNEKAWNDLKQAWQALPEISGDKERLEAALSLIVIYQSGNTGHLAPDSLSTTLDTLAAEYMLMYDTPHLHILADFLFREKGLHGSEENYYDPLNSNLLRVIQSKTGLPISLVSIYILVGKRVGLRIEGCNYPGHFLAIAYEREEKVLVDCYNGGKFITDKDFQSSRSEQMLSMEDIFDLECDSATMISRILRNLVNAYRKSGDAANERLMTDLLGLGEEKEDDSESP